MTRRFIIAGVVLLVIFGGISAVKYLQIQKMAAQMSHPPPPATIASTEVKVEAWQPNLKAVGSLVAVNGTAVSTEVGGKVAAIRFQSGQRVHQGEVLLELDATVDRATLEGLKADRRLAQIQLKRNKELLARKAVSRSQYDEARANYDAADARVSEQQEKLARKTIRAPFTGLLGIRQVNLGQYLSPGADIVRLQSLSPIYVDYALPASELDKVAVGQAVEVRVETYPGQVFEGKVEAIDAGINAGTRTVQVRATLANQDRRLRPGMFAEVRTLMPTEERVLTVPRTAISYNTYGDFVYVITPGKGDQLIARQRQVKTGAVRQGRVAIEHGLKAGERVVRAGQEKLRDGQAVQIDNSVKLNDAQVGGE